MLRSVVDSATRLAGWLRRGQQVMPGPGSAPLKINLGSALVVTGDWVHIDGSLSTLFASWPPPLLRLLYLLAGQRGQHSQAEYISLLKKHRFVHHNLEYGIPFPDRCADYIFSSHFLEHLSKKNGELLLREAFRVLQPGGMIRLSVPDLGQALAAYQEGRRDALDDIFSFAELGYFARHRYMYDYDMLHSTLCAIGFGDIQRRAFQQGRVPDAALLDRRSESLFVEATKPQ